MIPMQEFVSAAKYNELSWSPPTPPYLINALQFVFFYLMIMNIVLNGNGYQRATTAAINEKKIVFLNKIIIHQAQWVKFNASILSNDIFLYAAYII
jgi:hypothetical protein